MSLPRRLLSGQLQATSRRTSGQCFFLAPCAATNALLRYAWIHIASRFADQVTTYGFFFLSNHYHALLRDLTGGAASGLPAYFRDLNSLLARALNVQHGREGALWKQGSYANVEVHGLDTEIAQLLYLMAQPVAAGLTRTSEEWPGEKFLPEHIGTLQRAQRPDDHPFFATTRPSPTRPEVTLRAELSAEDRRRRESKQTKADRGKCRRRRKEIARLRDERSARERSARERADQERADQEQVTPKRRTSTLPEEVSYRIPVPQSLAHLPLAEARATLRRLHDANIERIHAERRAQGLDSYLGARAVLAQSPTQTPRARSTRFKLNPRIAASSKGERLALYEDLASWRADHAEGVKALHSETPWRARFPQGSHRRAQELQRILLAQRDRAPRAPPEAA